MRSTRARRAAMIGTAAVLLVAPCVAQAEPTPQTPALPADMVAAIQRDLGLTPAQYLERAKTGQELTAFANTLRGKFPTAFAGAWLDQSGTPLVGLAEGPDKAAARTAVEAAGYQVKDQSRSENALREMLGQLDGWVQQLPAPLAGLVNGTKIDTVNNDIALEVKDTAEGQGLQLPDSLKFVRVAKGPATGPLKTQGLGSSGSSGSSGPTTKPTEPTNPTASTIALNPVTGAKAGKAVTISVKVNPAAAGGDVLFEQVANGGKPEPIASGVSVKADGTATTQWLPKTAGKVTIKATFSGRGGVTGSTTTQEVTVAKADSGTVASTTTLDPITAAPDSNEYELKAKVTPAAAGGTVEFKDGTTVLGPTNVEADGTAAWIWSPETDGRHTITATFSGRNGVNGSVTTQEVTVTTVGPDVTDSTITINPVTDAKVGKALNVTAKVNPAAAGGTVEFKDGKTVLGTEKVKADGTAVRSWTPGTDGKHTITATFSGRDGVAGSTTTAQVTVAKADTTPAPDAVMGGEGYRSGETDSDPCSFGFNGTDGDGNAVSITAGHCDQHRENAGGWRATKVRKAGTYVGEFAKALYGNGPDYGWIKIDGSVARRFQNNLVSTHGGDPVRITGTADAVIGAPACKSGETTGWTCGPITAVDPRGFTAKVCVIPGDSGGAIVSGTKAIGITTGTNAWECEGVPNKELYGTPINMILAANPGLKVRTN
ncbi:Ig-like domain repeat protein [Rhodococcus sp. NPDC055112]